MKLKNKDGYAGYAVVLFVTAAVWLAGYIYLLQERDVQRELYLQKHVRSQEAIWNAVVNTNKIGMSAYFDAYILRPDVIKEMMVANYGSSKQKDKARKELYRKLLPLYYELQSRNVKQFHFQDRENTSFLRFHQPHNYGDSLNATRPIIVAANRLKKPMVGFETGRVVSGFRNVFPIIWEDQHLGSVELSQPFGALSDELEGFDAQKESVMLIKAAEVMPKLLDENKKLFSLSILSSNWMVENDPSTEGSSGKIDGFFKKASRDDGFLRLLESSKPFGYEIKKDGKIYAVAATPIHEISGKHTATLLTFVRSSELEAIADSFEIRAFYFSVLIALMSVVLIWLSKNKKALENEKRRLFAISQTMGEGMYVIDVGGRVRFINDAALSMLGYERGEVIGKVAHYLFHVHKTDRPLTLGECSIYSAVHTGIKYAGIDIFAKKSGENFQVDLISSQLRDGDNVVGSVTVFRDITDRIALEESLRALNKSLEERVEEEVSKRVETDIIFKNIFQNSPEGILILASDGRFAECNPIALKMLGYEYSELIGKRPCDISPSIQPDSGFFSENATKMFIANTLKGDIQRFEWTHLSKEGKEKIFEIMFSPLNIGDKKEVLVLWRDITKIKELEMEKEAGQALLIQQSKLAEMGTMIGAIAHQWKQPLNAVWIMTQELKMSYDYGDMTPDSMEKFKKDMGEQIRFMSQTIEDFRNFYKPSTAQTSFSVGLAVRSVISLLSGQIKKEAIDTFVDIDDSLMVVGYESEFKQVILNIVNNAREALVQNRKEGRRMQISVVQKELEVLITISDNAGGIPQKILNTGKLFEPYTTTKGDKGTGMGLSLSKIIIEQKMQGKIEARNTDDGAMFTIRMAVFYGAL